MAVNYSVVEPSDVATPAPLRAMRKLVPFLPRGSKYRRLYADVIHLESHTPNLSASPNAGRVLLVDIDVPNLALIFASATVRLG